jgi:hypothetical protein
MLKEFYYLSHFLVYSTSLISYCFIKLQDLSVADKLLKFKHISGVSKMTDRRFSSIAWYNIHPDFVSKTVLQLSVKQKTLRK